MVVIVFLLIVLSVVQTSLGAIEPTNEKDPQLPPKVQEALKDSVVDEDCEELVLIDGFSILRELVHDVAVVPQPITPCDRCHADGFLNWEIIPNGVRVAKYGARGLLIQVAGELTEVSFNCTDCHFKDDTNVEYTGTLNIIWSNGKLTFTIHRASEEDTANIELLLQTVDNFNPNTIQVECTGSKKFQDICLQTSQSGELHHAFQNTAEKVYVEEERGLVAEMNRKGVLAREFDCKRPV